MRDGCPLELGHVVVAQEATCGDEFLNGYYAPSQGMPLWTGGNGYHYKVLEDIKWFTSNGAVSDQHAATLNGLNGGTYCSL